MHSARTPKVRKTECKGQPSRQSHTHTHPCEHTHKPNKQPQHANWILSQQQSTPWLWNYRPGLYYRHWPCRTVRPWQHWSATHTDSTDGTGLPHTLTAQSVTHGSDTTGLIFITGIDQVELLGHDGTCLSHNDSTVCHTHWQHSLSHTVTDSTVCHTHWRDWSVTHNSTGLSHTLTSLACHTHWQHWSTGLSH